MPARSRDLDGIERRGVVLAFLMRFKQICNHPVPVAGRRRLGRGGQRQAGAAARDRRGNRRTPGEGPGLHPVPGDDGAARGVPRHRVRPARPRPAWRDRGQEAQGPGASVPGGRERPVFRALAQGGRRRAQPDRGVPRHPFRPLVEPGGREPGDRPRVPHRADQERAGAQVRLPRHRRGEDRPDDRGEAEARRRFSWGRRRKCC